MASDQQQGFGQRDQRLADTVERFRKALMAHHADDWDMETIAEAAHICARSVVARESDEAAEREAAFRAQFTGSGSQMAVADPTVTLWNGGGPRVQ